MRVSESQKTEISTLLNELKSVAGLNHEYRIDYGQEGIRVETASDGIPFGGARYTADEMIAALEFAAHVAKAVKGIN